MATALGNLLDCSICFESFENPKVLKCGHTFCLGCLERYIGDKRNTFPCPLCNQDINIPQGGAKMFVTNFILQTYDLPQLPLISAVLKCPKHSQRVVIYYCKNCNVGLCLKCVSRHHRDHETLDIECEETRNTAKKELQHSKLSIQNKIIDLEQKRNALVEKFEQLKSLCKDKKDIRETLEENRLKIEETLAHVTIQIIKIKSDIESNILSPTETTLNILQSLPQVKRLEKLCENMRVYLLDIQYLKWRGNNYSIDIDLLGSTVSKSYYIPNLNESSIYKFIFNVSDINQDGTVCVCNDLFTNNDIVWSCSVGTYHGDLYVRVLPTDMPNLKQCIIDGRLSLLNIAFDSITIIYTDSQTKLDKDGFWRYRGWWNVISWEELIDKNNGYLTSNNQFIVQFDITQIRDIVYMLS